MLIERAAPDDIDALLVLWRRSVDATHLHFITSDELDEMTPAVRNYLQNGQTEFWVLRDTRRLAGFMGLNSGKLESLFIAPESFRKGYGRRLVDHAISLSEELLVDVNEENASAIAFYESCGFVRTGRSELDEQGNHHPLVHMKREPGDSSGANPERRSSHQAPELRTDILTGRQCIVAPDRASRPAAFTPDPPLIRMGANGDLQDPFAEGNEQETPGERFALRRDGSTPNSKGWTLRVVPNRYPAVVPKEEFQGKLNGPSTNDFQFFPVQCAIGEHDVVIECPDSRSRWAELTQEEMTAVFSSWRTRIQQLAATGRFQSLSVFRNEGFSAGASLSHCHSQIIVHRELTPMDCIRHERQKAYCSARLDQAHSQGLENRPMDIVGALLEAELRNNVRIVRTSPRFVALCPFASRSAYHVRIVPRDGVPWTYADVADEAVSELAALTKEIVKRWADVLGSCPSFNMLLPHSRLDKPAQFRWMLELIPRTGRIAGLELLSDLDVVTVSPENAATRLATV